MKSLNTDALMQITKRSQQMFVKGEGSWLWDQQGHKILDFIQGWAVNTLGHSPALISQVLCEQSQQLLNPSPAFYNEPMLQCARTLIDHSIFDQVFFANSGAEANEGAIKLARKWGERYKKGASTIITFEDSFHGRTVTTMAASGKKAFAPLFEPKTEGFIKVPFNDIEAVKEVMDEQTVAILLEPILGEAGVIPADAAFLQALRALATAQNCLLMFDEVQTGVGRTGELFAYQRFNIEPDVMTLAKGLGGGVPIAALLAKKAYCVFEYGDQGGTFNGNPLMTAVANAVLNKVLKPSFLQHVNERSQQLRDGLAALSPLFQHSEVRGKGLLLALSSPELDANAVVDEALRRGLLLNAPNHQTLRFMPALTVSTNEVDRMLSLLDASIRATQ